MKIKFADTREDGATGGIMTIVADGFNAPVRCVRGPLPPLLFSFT